MIKDLDVEEIAQILQIDDTSELPCERGEWVQWLVSQAGNPKLKIMGKMNDAGELTGYIVILDNIIPPVFNSVVALHIWTTDHRDTHELVRAGMDWGREIGARDGLATVPVGHTEKYMEVFGGEKVATLYRWRLDED